MTSRGLAALLCLSIAASPASAQQHGGGSVPVAPPVGSEACRPALDPALLVLPSSPGTSNTQVTLYADPMGGGINSFGRTISNYVDLAPAANTLQDWHCGVTTYDGHQGIDIGILDFYEMDDGVPILAAAPGTVVARQDGQFDRRTEWINGVQANYVIVQHADGSLAYYWHMRKGSVQPILGQVVNTGDVLGMVGSSGFSSGPHLHFETQDGGTREPYTGVCQPAASRWAAQGPYVWDLPFALETHGLTTIPVTWPLLCERPPSKTHVKAGTPIYSWIRPRNLSSSDQLTWRFYSPLGLRTSYSWFPSGTYSSSWWYVFWNLPTTANLFGPWRVEILRQGVLIATQEFTLDANNNQLPVIPTATYPVAISSSYTLALGGSDADGSVFWHNLVSPPAHGTATFEGSRRRRIVYIPTPGYVGTDSIQVQAQDDENALGPLTTIRFDVSNLGVEPAEHTSLTLRATPQPVRGRGTLEYTLPRAGAVTLTLHDLRGARVRVLADGRHEAGRHVVEWNVADSAPLTAGVYFARLQTPSGVAQARVVLVQR